MVKKTYGLLDYEIILEIEIIFKDHELFGNESTLKILSVNLHENFFNGISGDSKTS